MGNNYFEKLTVFMDTVCVCVYLLKGCGEVEDAVGSLTQPSPPLTLLSPPLASLPLTSHLPCGLLPADRRWLILPLSLFPSLFFSFSFTFPSVASHKQDVKV